MLTNAQLKRRLTASALAILAAGLCAAALIFFNTEEAPAAAQSYVIVDGEAYPGAAQPSRRDIREQQRFGGKAAVLFDQFNRWFASLWRGRQLAHTVAWLSVLLALGLYLFARWLPPDAD